MLPRRRSDVKRLILSAIFALPAAAAFAMPQADLEAYLKAASAPERALIQTFVISCGTSLEHLENNDANGSIPRDKGCKQVLAHWYATYHAVDHKAAHEPFDI